jgi:hypothetical protein
MNCAGCLHSNRDALDAQLVQGVPYRSIAAAFDLSLGAISRHRKHVKEMIQARSSVETSEHGSALLARVEEVITEARAILVDAKANKSFGPATQALNSITRALELCARLSGELQAPNSGGIHLTKITNVNVTNYDDKELAGLLKEATCGWNPAVIARFQALTDSPESAITRP